MTQPNPRGAEGVSAHLQARFGAGHSFNLFAPGLDEIYDEVAKSDETKVATLVAFAELFPALATVKSAFPDTQPVTQSTVIPPEATGRFTVPDKCAHGVGYVYKAFTDKKGIDRELFECVVKDDPKLRACASIWPNK